MEIYKSKQRALLRVMISCASAYISTTQIFHKVYSYLVQDLCNILISYLKRLRFYTFLKFYLEDSDNFPTQHNEIICCPYRVCLLIFILEKVESDDTMVTEAHPNSHLFPGLWTFHSSARTKARSKLGYVIDQFY